MRLPDEISDFLEPLYPLLPQILPIVVVVLIPLLALTVANSSAISWQLSMVFESFGSLFSWSSSSESSDRKKLKKRPLVRTRAEQVALLNGDAVPQKLRADGYYPGLVNISGTYCFMNSTLQALASLSYLQPQIDDIYDRAVALNVATPVIDPLRDILHVLNAPRSHHTAERPVELIQALSADGSGKRNPLFSSREHQDAQELFQLISESIKNEATAVDRESLRDRGLGGISRPSGPTRRKDVGKTVFDGLTANRRSCVVCGYTEAVMHFGFDNWQLALPRSAACHLADCLYDYTRLEKLTDCICRKCSMLATYQRLLQEAERLTALVSVDPNASQSKRKRARDARKLEARVKAALDEGRIEEDVPGVKLEKVYSPESTKQAMVARPPPVLALHLNRSMHYGHHAAKNNCYVQFPETLDLTEFTTSGQLSTVPNVPISSQVPSRSQTPTPNPPLRTLYQLSSVVCHFGQHSYGHYICYRRKPRPPTAGPARYAPYKLPCQWGCECERCVRSGPVRADDEFDSRRKAGRGWLRISDDQVSECGIETVLQEGASAFMLFYEKVLQPRSHTPRASQTQILRGSEETVRQKDVDVKDAEIPRSPSAQGKLLRPRVVRNVSTGARRSPSVKPIERPKSPPVTMNGNGHHYQNGHASEKLPDVGSSSASWYQQPGTPPPVSSRVRSTSGSKSRSHHPSNSVQSQPQQIQA